MQAAIQFIVASTQLTHPFPMLMNAVAATLFMSFGSSPLDLRALVTLALSVACVHGAIWTFNDYRDEELDRRSKPSKPLVRGWATPRHAWVQSVLLAIVGVALSTSLGPVAAVVAVVVLAAGIWYDLAAKGTLFSWVPFAIFIPSLPLWGFAGTGRFEPVLLLAYPLGALISLGLNIANTLPDLEGDLAGGVSGLAHVLGRRHALWVTWAAFAGAITGVAVAAPMIGNSPRVLYPGLLVGALLLALMVTDWLAFRSLASLKRGWYVSAVLSVIIGLAWVASLPT
jgi:geranylgeranylglycerol-phosphate geranylgeranyltransferase